MAFCIKCGTQILEHFDFCPICGEKQVGACQTFAAPKVDGGTRGRSIAGMALGIGSLVFVLFSLLFLFFEIMFAYLGGEVYPATAVMFVYVFFFDLFAIGCAIPAKILSKKALVMWERSKMAKLGRIFGLIGIISGAATGIPGLIFLLF